MLFSTYNVQTKLVMKMSNTAFFIHATAYRHFINQTTV